MPVEEALPADQTVTEQASGMEQAPGAVMGIDDQALIDSRVDGLAATIAAIKDAYAEQSDQLSNAQILSNELQEQLGALSTANSDLEATLEEKTRVSADQETELAALRAALAARNAEFDQVSAQLADAERLAADTGAAKSGLEAQARTLTAEMDALLAELNDDAPVADAQPEDATEAPAPADEAAPVAEAPAEEAAPAAESHRCRRQRSRTHRDAARRSGGAHGSADGVAASQSRRADDC
jgi:fused signal recognition particle receptor